MPETQNPKAEMDFKSEGEKSASGTESNVYVVIFYHF